MLKSFSALAAFVFGSLVFASGSVQAACTVPNTLSNGTPADATAVMGNFNSLAGCAAPLASPAFTGSVGVNTSSPPTVFSVVGASGAVAGATFSSNDVMSVINNANSNLNFTASASGTAALLFSNNTTRAAGFVRYDLGNNVMDFSVNSGVRMTIVSGGNVGIGTSTPGYTLHVNGSVAGTSAYNNLSDNRLKKNVTPLNDGLALISRLRPVRFDWRSEAERPVGKALVLPLGEHQIGFLAQDLVKVLPEAVSTASGPDRIMSVAESKVVPVLVQAVIELKAANDNHLAEIKDLRAVNDQQALRFVNLETQVRDLQRKLGMQTASK